MTKGRERHVKPATPSKEIRYSRPITPSGFELYLARAAGATLRAAMSPAVGELDHGRVGEDGCGLSCPLSPGEIQTVSDAALAHAKSRGRPGRTLAGPAPSWSAPMCLLWSRYGHCADVRWGRLIPA
jgi:hypothetical protein